jgi:hypothetical protein
VEYPTKGFSLEVPCLAETTLTGLVATVGFERRGHKYEAALGQNHSYLRDGNFVAWDALPTTARATINKAVEFINKSRAL